jgi:hypothetical protein
MSPIPPPAVIAPFDTLESVLNGARTRLNDAIASLGGDILTDTQPFTGTMTNLAWRKLQAYLANLGYSNYKRKFWAIAMPVTATFDPSQPNIWTWTAYFDGTSYWSTPQINVLPFDLICPLYLRERQTGSNSRFIPMKYMVDGLIETRKYPWNRQWEWKNNGIYLPGTTTSVDLEVEYAAYDADFVTTNNILGNPSAFPVLTPANMYVPIMRCQSAFTNFLCAEALIGRDEDGATSAAAGCVTEAKEDAKLVMNNEVKLKQRTPVQRGAYSSRGRGRGSVYGNQY